MSRQIHAMIIGLAVIGHQARFIPPQAICLRGFFIELARSERAEALNTASAAAIRTAPERSAPSPSRMQALQLLFHPAR